MAGEVELELWYTALGSPSGIIVETSDPEAAKQKLYRLRDESKDEDLSVLSIVTSPTNPTKDLWIVKRIKPNET